MLRVRLLARLAEKLVFAQPPERAGELAAEAIGMARRLGEAGALAAALMGRHAALLHAEHAHERRRVGEQALALAGELGALELGALGRHWLLYDLAEMGELDEARRRQAELDQLADELQQPLYRHSSLAWRCVWAGLAGRFEEAERIARESVRLAEHAGAPDAQAHFTAQLVALRREQGRLARAAAGDRAPRRRRSRPRPRGAASCRSHISTRATGRAPRPHTREHSAAAWRDCPGPCSG